MVEEKEEQTVSEATHAKSFRKATMCVAPLFRRVEPACITEMKIDSFIYVCEDSTYQSGDHSSNSTSEHSCFLGSVFNDKN